jgi:hypothetical protein
LSRGIPIGLIGTIPIGTHTPPTSIDGTNDASKNTQKKEAKNIISVKRNQKKLTFIISSIQIL